MRVSAIVYTSNTGFTAKYAAMLSERTGLPCYSLKDAAPGLDSVLYLGWLCAGETKGLNKAANRFTVKAVCAVGMSPPNPAYTAKLKRPAKLEAAPLFYLRGGYAPKRLTGLYKLMMALMTKMVTRHPPENAEEAAMQDAFRKGGDWVDGAALEPVLAWLNG